MTLDELLALIPENETGDISATDMQVIVTELWNNTVALTDAVLGYAAKTNARIDALEQQGSTRSMSGIWRLDTNPAHTPADGQVVVEAGALESADWLSIAHIDRGGTNMANVFAMATQITAQDQDNANNWVKYNVNTVSANTGYSVFDVSRTLSNGTLATNNMDIVFVFTWTVIPE